MDSVLGFFLAYVLLYKYAALFILIFISSVIVPLPASAILLAVGAFSSQGYFNFWESLAVAQSANFLGDFLDYFLARKYGEPILRKFGASRSRFFTRLEKFIKTDTGLTIFFSRIAGSLSTVVSLLAGVSGVSYATFIFFEFAGNLLEVGSYLIFGYWVGVNWQDFISLFDLVSGIVMVTMITFIVARIYKGRRVSE